VSIYILIPLILVPQLLLGGAMIKFDDLHHSISKKIYVPFIGDIMVTRWAYEALCVEQFKTNKFEKPFFKYDMAISQNDWNASFLVPALNLKVDNCLTYDKNPDFKTNVETDLKKIKFHLNSLAKISGIQPGPWIHNLNYQDFDGSVATDAKKMLDSLKTIFRLRSRLVTFKRDSLFKVIETKIGEDPFVTLRAASYNQNSDVLIFLLRISKSATSK
jgi:hypothetical protein